MDFLPFNRVKPLTLEEIQNIKASGLPKAVYYLEKETMRLSKDVIHINEESYSPYCYLYHGIRFQKYLENLESIFKAKKILASKHLSNSIPYSDNCNKGEYVSLTSYSNNPGFKIFIVENISLLVSPECQAYLTKYVDYETWEQIKNKETKNLYSYMKQEFMCKDFVSLDYVKAVGVPYKYYVVNKGIEYAENVLNDVKSLIDKYEINIGIVDTSDFNRVLIEPEKRKIK